MILAPFSFFAPHQIILEPGSTARLDEIAGPLLGPRCLLVTDSLIVDLGLIKPAIIALAKSGIQVTLFKDVEADPSRETLEKAVTQARQADVTGVIGLGGGSSIDVAKLAALLLGSNENLDGAWGVSQAKGPRLPLVLAPTTAGTGSEVTPISIITVSGNEKRGVSSPLIMPDIALLDPALTLGLPPQITASTGVDAMVHAIEAFTSKNANNNPMSRMLAREALDLIGRNIEQAVFEGQNTDARSVMMLGSTLAGQAFANSPVAAVHALAYPIGGVFHIAHGLSNALILPQVLRFNAPACSDQYSELVKHAFPNSDVTDLAEGFETLIAKLGMPNRLRDVGIPEDALAGLAKDAMIQTRLLVNNPRELNETDALEIYRSAW